MIAQQGRIESIDGDEALVRIGGRSGCPACDEGKGCGAGIFGRLLRNKAVSVRSDNEIGAQVGEVVQLGIAEGIFVSLVLRLYALPVLAGLLGIAFGFTVATRSGLGAFASDTVSLVVGVAAAGLSLLWSRRGLREFPARTAVHLMRVAEAPESAACTARGPIESARPRTFLNDPDT
jgi:sigma-E factor negative regulatory protein RseC